MLIENSEKSLDSGIPAGAAPGLTPNHREQAVSAPLPNVQPDRESLPTISRSPFVLLAALIENACKGAVDRPLEIPPLSGALEVLRQGRGLRYQPQETRVALLKDVVDLMLTREDVGSAGLSTLPHLLRCCPVSERISLMRHALDSIEGNHRFVTKLLINVLRCSPSLEELKQVVDGIGRKRLEDLGSRQIREFIAWTVIGPAMRSAKLPQSVSTRLDLERANARIDELKAALEARLEIANLDTKLRGTEVAKRFRKIVTEDLQYIERQMRRFKATERMASRRTKEGSPEAAIRRRRGLAGQIVEMMKVEFTFGINMTCERNRLGRNVRIWKADEVRRIHELLSKKVPEGLTLFTPHLKEFRRVAGKGREYNGLRDRDGQIHVTDEGVKDPDFAKEFEMRSPLLAIVAHEQGHSVHIGEGRTAKTSICFRAGKILGPFDPLFNPHDFNELSVWRAYEPSRFTIAHSRQGVIIDGQTHPLDTPTRYRGQLVVFQHDAAEKLLYSYAAEAMFSARSYSRTSPWEDAAESFTEYILMPERLARFAPMKFIFWDLHIGKYEEKGWLYELANQKLQQIALRP